MSRNFSSGKKKERKMPDKLKFYRSNTAVELTMPAVIEMARVSNEKGEQGKKNKFNWDDKVISSLSQEELLKIIDMIKKLQNIEYNKDIYTSVPVAAVLTKVIWRTGKIILAALGKPLDKNQEKKELDGISKFLPGNKTLEKAVAELTPLDFNHKQSKFPKNILFQPGLNNGKIQLAVSLIPHESDNNKENNQQAIKHYFDVVQIEGLKLFFEESYKVLLRQYYEAVEYQLCNKITVYYPDRSKNEIMVKRILPEGAHFLGKVIDSVSYNHETDKYTYMLVNKENRKVS